MSLAQALAGTARWPTSSDSPHGVLELPHGRVLLLPQAAPGSLRLAVPEHDLLMVAGLPGAGKSTLLRSITDSRDVVLDPERLASVVRRAIPRVPYPSYRVLVHAVHRIRVLAAVIGDVPNLIVHEPGTRPRWRRLIVRTARWRGRAVHLLVVDADPEQAAAGRVKRGRTVPGRRAARHEREWARLCGDLVSGWASGRLEAEGFTGCVVVPRSALSALAGLRGGPTRPGSPD